MGDIGESSDGSVERRWPWFVCGALLIASGLLAVWATYLWWLPCRGALVSRGLLGDLLDQQPSEVSEACLLMLTDSLEMPVTPLKAWLTTGATALVGLSWLALLIGVRWTRAQRRAMLPLGLLLGVQSGLLLLAGSGGHAWDGGVALIMVATDLAALVALIVMLARWEGQRRYRMLGTLAWLGWSCSGLVVRYVDWQVMFASSGSYWDDNPPGLGYLVAMVPLVAGALMMIVVGRRVSPDRRVESSDKHLADAGV